MLTTKTVISSAANAIFGKPLVTNVYRSVIAEAIVAAALPDWTWCSADYAAHDFVHPDGKRLEVKQSALKQSWVSSSPPKPSWDIKPRTGYWKDGVQWFSQPGRNADIYVFGLHHIVDDTADHRDPSQWLFYVLAANALPPTQRLAVGAAAKLTSHVTAHGLGDEVERAARDCRSVPMST